MTLEEAKKICGQIREENKKKLFSFAKMQCWGCVRFTNGDEGKMCYASKPDGTGCNLVNAKAKKPEK